MVPAPESNNNTALPTWARTAQLLRAKDGTHVPEPRMVSFIQTDLGKALGDIQDPVDCCPGDIGNVFRSQI